MATFTAYSSVSTAFSRVSGVASDLKQGTERADAENGPERHGGPVASCSLHLQGGSQVSMAKGSLLSGRATHLPPVRVTLMSVELLVAVLAAFVPILAL